MKVHIVQVDENLQDIARKYNISVEDIIKNNQHISHARHILPGMKLKLPILSEEANTRFRDQMLQIYDYYPTLDDFQKADAENQEPINGDKQTTSDGQPTPTTPYTNRPQPTQNIGSSVSQPPYASPYYAYPYSAYPYSGVPSWPYYGQTSYSPYYYAMSSGNIPYVYPTYPSQPAYTAPINTPQSLSTSSSKPMPQAEEKKEPPKRLRIDLRQHKNESK